MVNPSLLNFRNLLDDDMFIQWVLHPTPELIEYWGKRIQNDDILKKDIYKLKNILENLRVKEPEISQEDKDLLWSKIESQIDSPYITC